MSTIIHLEKVSKEYLVGGNKVQALSGITWHIPKGVVAAIVGPSGSGKSTLLHLIGALDIPTAGKVIVDGIDLTAIPEKKLTEYRRKKVGFVFQGFNLIPNLSALENVMLPMEFAKVPASEQEKKAKKLLETVGLSQREKHWPNKLSGGEQQRVAIARSLANDPEIILADEPTGNIDSKTGKEIIALLGDLAHNLDKTVIIVTHDTSVKRLADISVEIHDGQIK